MTKVGLFVSALLIAAPLSDGWAKPKRPDGGKCDSTGTERRDGKDQNGNTVNCLFDSCTFTECKTTDGKIGGCVKKTTYSNARDCKEVSTSSPTGSSSLPGTVLQPGTIYEPSAPKPLGTVPQILKQKSLGVQ